jgi:hypothetical protein
MSLSSVVSIALVKYTTYLRSHELGGTTECAGAGAEPHILLAKTVIGNLDVAIQCQKDVVKLQITVNDTVLVEVLECQAHLSGVESVWLALVSAGKDRRTY